MDMGERFDRFDLPRDVPIYVDSCGINYAGPNSRGWRDRVRELGVARDFFDSVKGRRDLLITKEIYQELGRLVSYFKKIEREFGAVFDGENMEIASLGMKVYSDLNFTMRNNCWYANRTRNDVPSDEVEGFLDDNNVDFGERSLLLKMFTEEEESSLLTADGKAIRFCRKGLWEFNLDGRIYNVLGGNVENFSKRRIYNCV